MTFRDGAVSELLFTPRLLLTGLRVVSLFTRVKDSAVRPIGETLCARRVLPSSASDILVCPKSIMTLVPFMKSLSIRPASVGASTQKIGLNSRPLSTKETDCSPFMSRASPLTP